jgi:Methyltransferase small domain
MSNWQERITRDTTPGIRIEHELRYRAAAPLISRDGAWADLGCGNGVAAAAAFGTARARRMVLVDLDADAVASAAQELDAPDATQLAGDLTDPEILDAIGESLLSVPGERLVTCFEVVEHLASFVPLLEWSVELAREHRVTFLLSVPNDAFWSIQNPHHQAVWGEGSFAQLRRLLPAQHTLLRQLALSGSALASYDEHSPETHDVVVEVGGPAAVATHFIAAYGPRSGELRRSAIAAETDMLAQRRWERERESNLAVAEATVAEQGEQLREHVAKFDAWRTYIHELEQELGHPLSGVDEGSSE